MNKNNYVVQNTRFGQMLVNKNLKGYIPPSVLYQNPPRNTSPMRNQSPHRNKSPNRQHQQNNNKEDEEFKKKLDEIMKFANIDKKYNQQDQQYVPTINQSFVQNQQQTHQPQENQQQINQQQAIQQQTQQPQNNIILIKKNLLYGIKKTILSDFNHLYTSSNNNDFKIGLNKNINQNKLIFDCFYLFPNIIEINSKTETNTINEKKIEYFENKYEKNDIQYFPIDYVSCGSTIPMKNQNTYFNKLIIRSIYWNIYQTISNEFYKNNELLALIPEKNDFVYKKIGLYLHFELHSQISHNESNKILPYQNNKLKLPTPANTCLYKSIPIEISNLNGSYFNPIEIPLLKDLNISCAILCLKVSVPDFCQESLKGFDKNNKVFCGHIPFSQFIVNFDYELV